MANTVFGWPDAWPGSGAPRLLTAGAGSARGLVLARNAARPALVRKATLGDDAGHPVRLWDVDSDNTVVRAERINEDFREDGYVGAEGRAASVAWAVEAMGRVGVGAFDYSGYPVWADNACFREWLTAGNEAEARWSVNPSLRVSVGLLSSATAGFRSASVTFARAKYLAVGFPTVAAGCAMRARFWDGVLARAEDLGRAPSGGYPGLRLRATVRGALGVAPGGVWPERFETALLGEAEVSSPFESAVSARWRRVEGEVAFAVPESRVVVFGLEFADPVGTVRGVMERLPEWTEADRMSTYEVEVWISSDSELNPGLDYGLTFAPGAAEAF